MAMDVTDSTFEAEVIETSRTVPVLVDFWAEWCGPCRMVGPVVEALEKSPDYTGRFRLAKVNTDQNPQISGQFGISSIPAFKLFANGEVAGEFVGALPEHALRRFLDQNLPDPALEKLAGVAAVDPVQAARDVLDQGLNGPGTEQYLWQGALHLLHSGAIQDAQDEGATELKRILGGISEIGSPYSDARTGLLAVLDRSEATELPATLENFRRLLTDEPGARSTLEYFLSRVAEAPAAARGQAKDLVLLAFRLLGNQGPLVNEYRRKLSSLLF